MTTMTAAAATAITIVLPRVPPLLDCYYQINIIVLLLSLSLLIVLNFDGLWFNPVKNRSRVGLSVVGL